MIEKFIDIQAKMLSYIAFSDSKCDEKEEKFYINFLNTLEIPKEKSGLYLSYIKNPPSTETILKEISRLPNEITLSCIKNAYLMAMCSNGLCNEEKESLIKLGRHIGLKNTETDSYFNMLDSYYQMYLLENEIFENINRGV